VIVTVAVVAALLIGAVTAYAGLADDATPPVTTSDAAASYWNDAVVTLTATDDEGVAYIYHELDDDIVRLYTVEGAPLSAERTAPRDWMGDLEPLAPGEHALKFWAQDVNGNVEAKQSVTFTVKADNDAPETAAGGASDGAWYKAALTISLTATDNVEGSGVASISSTLDAADPVIVDAAAADVPIAVDAVTHANDGAHTLAFAATDVAGNVESAKTITVNVDTRKPAPKAYAATARRGRTATLKYKVVDAAPNCGTAAVKVVVKNRAGKVVKTLKYAKKAVNKDLAAKFTVPRTWRIGTYKFYVSTTDGAGNAQVKVAVNKLVVK
jgi:hypothetical protein